MSTPGRRSLRPSRFLRISTRGLMLLVLLVAAKIGWIVNRAHVQRDAVAAIRRAGGTVYFIYKNDDGKYVAGSLGVLPWLASFAGVDYFDTAVAVSLPRSAVDADLVAVGRLYWIETLLLRGAASLTDEGLEQLAGLHHVKSLYLEGAAIKGGGLVHLKGMAGLLHLDLDETQVDGVGLEHLQGLTSLKILRLSGTRVDDAGLVHLAKLRNLEYVELTNTHVTDAGVAQLNRATPQLRINRASSR